MCRSKDDIVKIFFCMIASMMVFVVNGCGESKGSVQMPLANKEEHFGVDGYFSECWVDHNDIFQQVERDILNEEKLSHLISSIEGVKSPALRKRLASDCYQLLIGFERDSSAISNLSVSKKKHIDMFLKKLLRLEERTEYSLCQGVSLYASYAMLNFLMSDYEQAFKSIGNISDYGNALQVLEEFEYIVKQNNKNGFSQSIMGEIVNLKAKIRQKSDYDINRKRGMLERRLETALLSVSKQSRISEIKGLKKEFEILGDAAKVSLLVDRLQFETQPEKATEESLRKIVCYGDFVRWETTHKEHGSGCVSDHEGVLKLVEKKMKWPPQSGRLI